MRVKETIKKGIAGASLLSGAYLFVTACDMGIENGEVQAQKLTHEYAVSQPKRVDIDERGRELSEESMRRFLAGVACMSGGAAIAWNSDTKRREEHLIGEFSELSVVAGAAAQVFQTSYHDVKHSLSMLEEQYDNSRPQFMPAETEIIT